MIKINWCYAQNQEIHYNKTLVFNKFACEMNKTKFIMINAITKVLIIIIFKNFSGFIQEKSRKK